jgi:hypothetical protein
LLSPFGAFIEADVEKALSPAEFAFLKQHPGILRSSRCRRSQNCISGRDCVGVCLAGPALFGVSRFGLIPDCAFSAVLCSMFFNQRLQACELQYFLKQ